MYEGNHHHRLIITNELKASSFIMHSIIMNRTFIIVWLWSKVCHVVLYYGLQLQAKMYIFYNLMLIFSSLFVYLSRFVNADVYVWFHALNTRWQHDFLIEKAVNFSSVICAAVKWWDSPIHGNHGKLWCHLYTKWTKHIYAILSLMLSYSL